MPTALQREETILKSVHDALKLKFDGHAFGLIIFNLNNPTIGNYISNGKRSDMIKAMRLLAKSLEDNTTIPAAQGTMQ